MGIAYKYIPVEDGLIIIFEEEIHDFAKGVALGFVKIKDEKYMTIGENNLFQLTDGTLPLIEKSEAIYIAVSEKNEMAAGIQGRILLDRFIVGKLIAHAEM